MSNVGLITIIKLFILLSRYLSTLAAIFFFFLVDTCHVCNCSPKISRNVSWEVPSGIKYVPLTPRNRNFGWEAYLAPLWKPKGWNCYESCKTGKWNKNFGIFRKESISTTWSWKWTILENKQTKMSHAFNRAQKYHIPHTHTCLIQKWHS